MPTLSLIMIVKDEASCLAECLRSVAPIVDEMVVADTGSTDETPQIARSFGARVVDIPWKEDFACARNQGMAHATGDWLLHMDADEVLDETNARRIRNIVDDDGGGADAIETTLANYCNEINSWRWIAADPNDPYSRGFSGYLAVPLLRLFRNHKGFEYHEPVHENISESVLERGGVIRREPILIHHYGYAGQTAEPKVKDRIYLDIERRKAKENPGDPKAWHDLGMQLLALEELDEGEEALRRAHALAPHFLDASMGLVNCLLSKGDFDAAEEVLAPFIGGQEAPPQVHTAIAAIDYKRGRLERAESRLAKLIAVAPRAVAARLFLARVLDVLGRSPDAAAMLQSVLDIVPGLPAAAQRMEAHVQRTQAESRFLAGQSHEALDLLVKALRLDSEDPLTYNNLGVVFASMGLLGEARENLERAVALAPGYAEARQNLSSLA